MKKKFATAAIALIALCGASTFAQKPATTSTPAVCPQTDCPQAPCTPAQCTPAQCTPQQCDRPCGNPCDQVFAGLNLTDAQKQSLNQLKTERRASRQAADSVRRADRRQERADYLAKVKKILTPDQYTAFLEGLVLNRPDGGRRAPRAAAQSRQGRKVGEMHARRADNDRRHKMQARLSDRRAQNGTKAEKKQK